MNVGALGRAIAIGGAALGLGLAGTPPSVPIAVVAGWLIAYICRAFLVYRLSAKALDRVSADQLASVLTAIGGQLPLDTTPWDASGPDASPAPPGGVTPSG